MEQNWLISYRLARLGVERHFIRPVVMKGPEEVT